jgi:hypothetical protein
MKSKPTLVVLDPKGDTELFKLCMSKLGSMSERLPFDQGREAYLAHKTPDENPYGSDDFGCEEWLNGCMVTAMALSKQDKVVDATKQEYAFSTHCMSCDNGKNYQIDDNIPESCPVCGEHKEYSIVNMNSLKGN